MQTAEGYWTVTNGARRPVETQLSRPSLRIEICVVYFIGRSPTQLVLCHKSIWNASYFEKNYQLITKSADKLTSEVK